MTGNQHDQGTRSPHGMCCTGPLGPTGTNTGARKKCKQHVFPLSLGKSYSRESSFCVDQWILEKNQRRKGVMLEYEIWLRFGLKPPWGNLSFHNQIRPAGVNTEKTQSDLLPKSFNIKHCYHVIHCNFIIMTY